MRIPVAQWVALTPVVLIGSLAAILASGAPTLIAAVLQVCILSAAVLAAARAVWILGAGLPVHGVITPISDARQVMRVISGDRRSPIIDRESGLFVDWYIRLRIEEEIARAERFGQRFSVVRLAPTDSAGTSVARPVAASLREVDCAGDFGDAVVVLLPNTDRDGAFIWREKRLGTSLDASLFSVKEYPSDGQTLSQLLGEDTWASGREHEFAA